jgi:hypothetical protein
VSSFLKKRSKKLLFHGVGPWGGAAANAEAFFLVFIYGKQGFASVRLPLAADRKHAHVR